MSSGPEHGCVRLRAPAKLNLGLAVLGRRPDGFHELETVLLAIGLCDTLEVRSTEGDAHRLQVLGPQARGIPAGPENLVLRAAQAIGVLARARGLATPGLAFTLEKHIPSAAGLGGGSSDAAAAARACARIYGLEEHDPEIAAALARLGSDCPFFLLARESGLARCTGRGERVEPLPALALPWGLLVVTPALGCDTATVYAAHAARARRGLAGGTRVTGPLPTRSLAAFRAACVNDLEPAALELWPELGCVRELLEVHAPGTFRLSGSGSSWFGFCEDEGRARALAAELARAFRARDYALRACWAGPLRSWVEGPLSSKSQ